MNPTISYLITTDSVTITIPELGVQKTLARDSDVGKTVLGLIRSKAGADEIMGALQPRRALPAYTSGAMAILDDGTGTYKLANDDVLELPASFCERVLDLVRAGVSPDSLARFMARLAANPSRRAVTELFAFLAHRKMPITVTGTFLAYKAVTSDYLDKHTRTVDNHPGCTPYMERQGVCDNANEGCSRGFHAGSLEYAVGFARGDDKLLIVEVDPANVVSIPHDCGCQKLRCNTYRVLCDYTGPLPENVARASAPYEEPEFDDEIDEDDDRDEALDDLQIEIEEAQDDLRNAQERLAAAQERLADLED